ncbi:hypothetical protein CTA1_159 [Colletotrichum tanaceti]|uniref:Uncharacterized protein n=1 Tax=Colletotrichum tanaceti TaxID=1306861 RepID=A0A4U6X4H4_9PEZI|nr:hypothetical protein CTA1_159 [Colletotrichum tanaceti]
MVIISWVYIFPSKVFEWRALGLLPEQPCPWTHSFKGNSNHSALPPVVPAELHPRPRDAASRKTERRAHAGLLL